MSNVRDFEKVPKSVLEYSVAGCSSGTNFITQVFGNKFGDYFVVSRFLS